MTEKEKENKEFIFPENGIHLGLGVNMNPGKESQKFIAASGRMFGKSFVTELVKIEARVAAYLMGMELDKLTSEELIAIFKEKLLQKNAGWNIPWEKDSKHDLYSGSLKDDKWKSVKIQGVETGRIKPKPKPDPAKVITEDDYEAFKKERMAKAELARIESIKENVSDMGCSGMDDRNECNRYPVHCQECEFMILAEILGTAKIDICVNCQFDENKCYYQNHGGPTENFKCGSGPYLKENL